MESANCLPCLGVDFSVGAGVSFMERSLCVQCMHLHDKHRQTHTSHMQTHITQTCTMHIHDIVHTHTHMESTNCLLWLGVDSSVGAGVSIMERSLCVQCVHLYDKHKHTHHTCRHTSYMQTCTRHIHDIIHKHTHTESTNCLLWLGVGSSVGAGVSVTERRFVYAMCACVYVYVLCMYAHAICTENGIKLMKQTRPISSSHR